MLAFVFSLLLGFLLPLSVSVESTGGRSISLGESVGAPIDGEAESFLKNAATAMESYAAGRGGSYVGANLEQLTREGIGPVSGLAFRIISAHDLGYCLEAGSGNDTLYYDSGIGMVDRGHCAR